MPSPYDLIPSGFMNLARAPLDLFQDFGKNLDLFNSMFSGRSGLEIKEDKKNVYVKAALPGVNPDEIEVHLDQGILQIKGETREKKEEKGEEKRVWQERQKSFWYRFSLPSVVDENAYNATYENGILELTFPKAEKTKKKLNIKTKKS